MDEYRRRYYEQNKEKLIQYQKKYYTDNKKEPKKRVFFRGKEEPFAKIEGKFVLEFS